MSFHRDEQYAARIRADEVDRFVLGEYLVTYTSPNEQVRAYLFRKSDGQVQAHVTDLDHVHFRNVTDLRDYAQKHGFADRFRLILIEQ